MIATSAAERAATGSRRSSSVVPRGRSSARKSPHNCELALECRHAAGAARNAGFVRPHVIFDEHPEQRGCGRYFNWIGARHDPLFSAQPFDSVGHLARHSVLDLRHLPRMEGELLIG